MYQAKIFFEAYEDTLENGETNEDVANYWDETFTADSAEQLKQLIVEATYTEWKDIEHEDANGYPTRSEYWTNYPTSEDNQGKATEREVRLWKEGKSRLWSIHCHILVSKISLSETKAVL